MSYPNPFEKGLTDVFIAAEEVGFGVNPDVNSGNPIGMGLGAAGLFNGERTTAYAYLENAPPNLTIVTNAPAAKLLMSGKRATGVKTIDGVTFHARRDVIVSCGALDSPKLLMLSGIGPVQELEKHGIEIVHDLPHVGKNMQDHCFSTATLLQKPGTNDRMTFETNAEAVAAARVQYQKDKTGLITDLYNACPMGWFKNEAVFKSSEFQALDKSTQDYLRRPTIPTFEITSVSRQCR